MSGLRPRHAAVFALSLTCWAGFLSAFLVVGSPRVFAGLRQPGPRVTEAAFGERRGLGAKCGLCPFKCWLTEGARGKCRVRAGWDGGVWTLVDAQPVSVAVDPVEKKPVFHMLPGTAILSVATVGCPLRCSFCQNWGISQAWPEETGQSRRVPPGDLVKMAVAYRIPSIAYTYSEPVAFYEYMLETCRLARRAGLRNVVVTSGWINPEPLARLAPYLDVVKVDLKGFSDDFYRDEVGGRIGPVLETLKALRRVGVLVEVVNLVIPGRNDSEGEFRALASWVRENMGADTPLFFTRFHPDFRMRNLPPTPVETLKRARAIAMEAGLNYVYLGNAPGAGGEDTLCPADGTLLVGRSGYEVRHVGLRGGKCPACGRKIPGIWL